MVGGFLCSALYQIFYYGFFAFVSIMVVFYVLLFKINQKPRSCTNKTLTSKVLFISHLSMLEAVPWHF